ncbi:Pentatricopeptide repeat-containing protein [Cynara cardunculus var. scolymus]|uniref:Pentatricopeptide repeat-containing protein n=1 Tax=Cynara cardunculus var. scolymus TaxID=59895 RepID=A0A103YNF5_CYNCS|nr:Pentatricopeptide repeat-containing protein [Cynara cardunculus var. scolymus]
MGSLPGPAVNPFPSEFNRLPESKAHTGSMNVSHGREGPLSIDDESMRRERKEQSNKKIASQKAISVILRREATMAVIEKKKGSTRLFPGTVLEALHERIAALRWESALKVFELLREQLWYRPNSAIYVKLIVMLGKCKQPEKAQSLFQAMIDEGCIVNQESYTALLSAYSRSGIFVDMESTLVEMLRQRECKPDVWTMNSTLRAFGGSGQIETMEKCYEKFLSAGIQPNIKTFNILLDSYGKTGNYKKMSAVMEYMQKYHFSWSLVTYNIVIDAFGRAGDLNQMEFLFRLMQSESIKPNCVTLCSLIRGYAQAGKVEKIRGLLRYIESSDVTVDTVFFNCLVDAYGMMGCLAEMKEVLPMMESKGCQPDKITYRTMIKAYNMNGMSNHVKELRHALSSVGKPESRR